MQTYLVEKDKGIICSGCLDWVTKSVQDLYTISCQHEAESIGTDEREIKSDSNMLYNTIVRRKQSAGV